MARKEKSDSARVKARIIQVIEWEQRKNFFHGINYKNDGEYDLLNVRVNDAAKWYAVLFPDKISKRLFGEDSLAGMQGSLMTQFGVWQKRPHGFKKGDEVEVEVRLRKVSV